MGMQSSFIGEHYSHNKLSQAGVTDQVPRVFLAWNDRLALRN